MALKPRHTPVQDIDRAPKRALSRVVKDVVTASTRVIIRAVNQGDINSEWWQISNLAEMNTQLDALYAKATKTQRDRLLIIGLTSILLNFRDGEDPGPE